MSQGVDPSFARATSGLTIGMLLRQRARLHPERPAIIDGSRLKEEKQKDFLDTGYSGG